MNRWQFAWAWTVGVVLAAAGMATGVAVAQEPPPVIEILAGGTTVRANIADFPTCVDNRPRLIYALDGAGATDCSVGGAVPGVEVLCSCIDGSYVAVGGGPHAATHQDGGADEIDVSGLAGVLAEGQPFNVSGDLFTRLEADCSAVDQGGGVVLLTCGDGMGYSNIADEGVALGQRSQLNFIGVPITCADNTEDSRTDCTLIDDDVPEAGDFGALALTGDLTSTGLATALAADTVGLAELAACLGPGEIVEYGASGVPSCIATPSGSGIGGSTGSTDNALLRADGVGGSTLQASATVVEDSGIMTVTAAGTFPQIRAKGGAPGSSSNDSGQACFGIAGSSQENCIGYVNETTTAFVGTNQGTGRLVLRSGGFESLILAHTGNATFLGTAKINGMTHHGSRATAPATCTTGDWYSDTSGAACFCSATNTWSRVFPLIPTTENCS